MLPDGFVDGTIDGLTLVLGIMLGFTDGGSEGKVFIVGASVSEGIAEAEGSEGISIVTGEPCEGMVDGGEDGRSKLKALSIDPSFAKASPRTILSKQHRSFFFSFKMSSRTRATSSYLMSDTSPASEKGASNGDPCNALVSSFAPNSGSRSGQSRHRTIVLNSA